MAVAGTAAASSVSDQMSGDGFNSTQFLVNYMLMEADLADQKAKRLREQADDLARRFGVSLIAQEVYGESSLDLELFFTWLQGNVSQ